MTPTEWKLATHGPTRLRCWSDGGWANPSEVEAWDAWNLEHGFKWRLQHGVATNDDLERVNELVGGQMTANLPDVRRRLGELLDSLPELFVGPAPADPPGWPI